MEDLKNTIEEIIVEDIPLNAGTAELIDFIHEVSIKSYGYYSVLPAHAQGVTSVDYNGRSLAKIRPIWLHGCPNRSWSDMWLPYHCLPV